MSEGTTPFILPHFSNIEEKCATFILGPKDKYLDF